MSKRKPTIDDVIITCWCGVQGTADELFAPEWKNRGCGGTGTVDCLCGGDFCVCHNHGSVECDGCLDCDFDDEDQEHDNRYPDEF